MRTAACDFLKVKEIKEDFCLGGTGILIRFRGPIRILSAKQTRRIKGGDCGRVGEGTFSGCDNVRLILFGIKKREGKDLRMVSVF